MAFNLPTDTFTFLFTDIEGSTQLWEKHPDAMQAALARHDALLRQAIETHGGHVFKTVGDSFCAAFTNAPQALSAALDAQRTLQTESWGKTVIKVRMGLHSGAAEMRDNDYFGPTLNRVARLMSAGHGGQTLLSAITRELVQPALPPDVELRDMGECALKDLIRPEHIYQLSAAGLQADFSPLKTLEAFRTNLPVQLTNYIRREKEFSIVKGLMAEHRLLTLTGSGGTGKTRLSLQIAADLLDSFPDGVWFIEFAPLADPALVPQTVLTTLGLHEETGRPVLETLTHYLASKEVLLILDNCEHLIEAVAQLAETVLHACHNLRLLASSREALGIAGEKTYYVRSLSIPNTRVAQSVETVTEYEAVRLFIDRAQTASSDFSITPANVSSVAKICARLDGIPLAIELAAARIKLLKVEQIAERLDDRFRLLTGGSRTALPRQQTLRAMIDWSYDLLPESERVLLRRLSVFAGGWTLEAAETVCQGPGIDDYNVLDPLAQLVNKSLVVVDADNAETRYHLLETVRQYAREKLSETGEGMAVRDLYLQYFLGLAEGAELELTGPRVVEWMKRLEDELDNIRAALEWSLKRDVQVGLRLVNALFLFWDAGGHLEDGRYWLTQLLKQPQLHTIVRARALGIQGVLAGRTAHWARPIFEESLALYRELEDRSGIAFNLLHLGLLIFRTEDIGQGRRLVAESLTIYQELEDKLGIASVLSYLGSVVDTNDYQRTQAYLEQGLAIFREIGHLMGIAKSLSDLGNLALFYGEYRAARLWLEETLAIERQFGKGGNIIYSLTHLGELAARQGDYIQARAYYEESLSIQTGAGRDSIGWSGWVLVKLGYAALWQGDTVRASRLFEESLQNFEETREQIGIVYTLEGWASLAVLQHQPQRASQLFAWADAMRGELLDRQRPPVEQADVDRDLALIHTQLDGAAFAAAQAAGRAMSMDEAMAYALESTYPSIRPNGQSHRPDVPSGGQDD